MQKRYGRLASAPSKFQGVFECSLVGRQYIYCHRSFLCFFQLSAREKNKNWITSKAIGSAMRSLQGLGALVTCPSMLVSTSTKRAREISEKPFAVTTMLRKSPLRKHFPRRYEFGKCIFPERSVVLVRFSDVFKMSTSFR